MPLFHHYSSQFHLCSSLGVLFKEINLSNEIHSISSWAAEISNIQTEAHNFSLSVKSPYIAFESYSINKGLHCKQWYQGNVALVRDLGHINSLYCIRCSLCVLHCARDACIFPLICFSPKLETIRTLNI